MKLNPYAKTIEIECTINQSYLSNHKILNKIEADSKNNQVAKLILENTTQKNGGNSG